MHSFCPFLLINSYSSVLNSQTSMSIPKPISFPALFFIIFFFISVFVSPVISAFFAPILKDHTTHQYTISIFLKTPLQPTNLVLDLGATFSWVDCTKNYNSTTYHNIPCETPLYDALHSGACFNGHDGPPRPGNTNNSCALLPLNPVTRKYSMDDALVDSLALPTTAAAPGKLSLVPEFILSCSKTFLLKGLAKAVTGLAAFGRSNFSLPAQVSRAYAFPYLFALCLSGSRKAPGAAIFNTSGPYYFSSVIDLSKHLIYTPLLLNPVDFNGISSYPPPSDEYFIGVTMVKVNGKSLALNKTLLTIDKNGFGGTRISTVVPYTVLETSIFNALTKGFVKESAGMNLTATTPVKPFSVCYRDVLKTRVGPAVPTIDLVMGSKNVFWRIFGANSMVKIGRKDADVWCLGVVDGGANTRSSIVIGGQQLEDNFLQFDVLSKRLGFSSSILAHGTSCANFTF